MREYFSARATLFKPSNRHAAIIKWDRVADTRRKYPDIRLIELRLLSTAFERPLPTLPLINYLRDERLSPPKLPTGQYHQIVGRWQLRVLGEKLRGNVRRRLGRAGAGKQTCEHRDQQ